MEKCENCKEEIYGNAKYKLILKKLTQSMGYKDQIFCSKVCLIQSVVKPTFWERLFGK